jgi:hypothetical protein
VAPPNDYLEAGSWVSVTRRPPASSAPPTPPAARQSRLLNARLEHLDGLSKVATAQTGAANRCADREGGGLGRAGWASSRCRPPASAQAPDGPGRLPPPAGRSGGPTTSSAGGASYGPLLAGVVGARLVVPKGDSTPRPLRALDPEFSARFRPTARPITVTRPILPARFLCPREALACASDAPWAQWRRVLDRGKLRVYRTRFPWTPS